MNLSSHHHHRVVQTDRSAAPWPLKISVLHRDKSGIALASSWTRLSQVRRGRPRGLVQLVDGFLPSWLFTIKSKALFAARTLGSKRATWPERDRRRFTLSGERVLIVCVAVYCRIAVCDGTQQVRGSGDERRSRPSEWSFQYGRVQSDEDCQRSASSRLRTTLRAWWTHPAWEWTWKQHYARSCLLSYSDFHLWFSVFTASKERTYMHHLNGHFAGEPGLAGCPLSVIVMSERWLVQNFVVRYPLMPTSAAKCKLDVIFSSATNRLLRKRKRRRFPHRQRGLLRGSSFPFVALWNCESRT